MPEAQRYQHYEVLLREDGSPWELGRGAMGITYKAFDTNLRCAVALKVINSTYLENDTAKQRFLREARAAAALRHPNVASVFNLSTDRDNYFYVMEFIDGETVEARVKGQGPMELAESLNITLQVARALAAAAKQRLVHRDLKPSNLMLVDEEGEQVVKVIDFGLAKGAKDGTEDTATLTIGGFVGTPHFASPEQIEEGDLDFRSDIYSLGATLYFMLTGKTPFSGSVGQVMSQHLYKPVDTGLLANLPGCVVRLIQGMLEKDRNKRSQTPRDLQNEIIDCLKEIRSTQVVERPAETSAEPLTSETLLIQNYRLIKELRESPEGRHFLAEDLRARRLVCLLILKPELASDPHWFAPLQAAVERVRKVSHPMLRAIYSLEMAGGHTVLSEEHVYGPSLLDLLRSRSVFSASEVVRLLDLLAPLADLAAAHQLQHIDFSLAGIHFVDRESVGTEILLRRSLTAWANLEPKVNGIDFIFTSSAANTLAGAETTLLGAINRESHGSGVRSLSLLAYELLGGQRATVETTAQYRPIATLSQEGNAVLRRGLIDEYPTVHELAAQLSAAVGLEKSTVPLLPKTAQSDPGTKAPQSDPGTKAPIIPDPLPQIVSPERAAPQKRHRLVTLGPILILGAIVSLGIGGYFALFNSNPALEKQTTEIPTLSVQSDPPGALILLDNQPAQTANSFTKVPFGKHRLTATLDGYEPIHQEIEVRQGMAPAIRLKLKEIQEIASLSIRSDPPGASIQLDGQPAQTANTFTKVPFGKHQLTASLKDYEAIKQEIEAHRGMVPEILLKLREIREIAALSIQTDPPGAIIFLDGKPPQTANTFTKVPFGTHQLTANLDDYEPIKQEIQVSRGMDSEIRLKLTKKLSPLEALMVELKKYDEGTPQQVTAYVRLAQYLKSSGASNFGESAKKLGNILEQLRTRVPAMSKDAFNLSYKESVKEATDLNILPAILWLAENENGTEAFNLFLRAANSGDSYAMMKVGRLYLRKGTPADDEEGFKWLNQAYHAPNPNLEAGAYVADCYLSGKGTKQDIAKAEEIVIPLANQNVVPAMTLAGRILQYKGGVKRAEAANNSSAPARKQLIAEANELDRQARDWWERASEKEDWNASARLAQAYADGWGGLEKNEAEAERRYKEGVAHGNALSMFFYGLMIEKKPSRRGEAENLISQAAAIGLASARKWCNENNVKFTETLSDDARQ
jgi:TPR repeat protein